MKMTKLKNQKNRERIWKRKLGAVSGTNSLAKAFFIFDLDGTLYPLNCTNLAGISTGQVLGKNMLEFFMKNLNLRKKEVERELERIKKKYDGEISIGLEKEYGINRYDYFKQNWNMNPEEFIPKSFRARKMLEPLQGRVAVLTAAPKIWADKVLKYLELNELISVVFTGEPDIRKPKPEAFQQVLDYFKIQASQAYFIGDIENLDIIPAKKLGMKTIMIGKSSQADFQVDSLDDLAKLIRKLK